MLTFGQPAGFWALLAIPAVLAIHFLQRESRRVVVSTLFLLEQLAPESASGRRWERLRQSVPLWLQVLAVLLLTWLLTQPRWLRHDSVQRVVLVLDSSASMSAFHSELNTALDVATRRLARLATTTEWQVAETDTDRPPLYRGTDRAALLRAVSAWQPHLGTHDFTPALQAAQTLLRGTGTLVLVSDRPTPVPEGVRLLTVGHEVENCGFAGISGEGRQWKALIRNYGSHPQTRRWWIESTAGQKSPERELTLGSGQTASVAGEIPAGAEQCELVLAGDAFTWDDRLPYVAPKPKSLTFALSARTPTLTEFLQRFTGSVEHSGLSAQAHDLSLVEYDPFHPGLPSGPAIVFGSDPTPGKFLTGQVITESSPLTADLNWSGLLCRESIRIPSQPGDQTLVWFGDRSLLFLREIDAKPVLVVNFDLAGSNAARLPAFVLLLHRFAESIRAGKVMEESLNVECHQVLAVASRAGAPAPAIPGAEPGPLRAPDRPAFFEVRQGERPLLHGAAQFADVREADFHGASSGDDLAEAERRLVERNSRTDFLTPVWLLALGVVMGASWAWKER